MWRYLIGAAVLLVVASEIPRLVEQHTDEETVQSPQPAPDKIKLQRTAKIPAKKDDYVNPLEGRIHKIKADRRGHFMTTARFNGSPVEVLVDTGATAVAINRSTARRIGIRLNESDFKYLSNTANGQAKYARATIREIKMGRIVVQNVQAAVLFDRSLNGILLGNSFLTKLREYKVKNGSLVLVQ